MSDSVFRILAIIAVTITAVLLAGLVAHALWAVPIDAQAGYCLAGVVFGIGVACFYGASE
jgi:hypothetical protein